ncbi:hypothetical protein RRG08_041273 [Elysia crispata]|uniref:Uncharacterized protein n=1 Tax=Elysia crispata TaxID=231223 RepID=A0AAE1E5K3_9GAST|nr:hypothetical protein RRG08_041273 [Elysia crispata]
MARSRSISVVLTLALLGLLVPVAHAQLNYCEYVDLIYKVLLGCPPSKNPLCAIVDFFENVIFKCNNGLYQPMQIDKMLNRM